MFTSYRYRARLAPLRIRTFFFIVCCCFFLKNLRSAVYSWDGIISCNKPVMQHLVAASDLHISVQYIYSFFLISRWNNVPYPIDGNSSHGAQIKLRNHKFHDHTTYPYAGCTTRYIVEQFQRWSLYKAPGKESTGVFYSEHFNKKK